MANEEWLVDGPRVIDLEGITRVKIGLIGGQVDVVAHDEPTARVEVHSVSGRSLRIAVQDGSLVVDHPQIRWDDWLASMRSFTGSARADVSLLVPRAVAVKLGVVSASALVSGVHGDASVSTVSGDVVVDSVEGDLQLSGVSGDMAVREHRGAVSARTVSGGVTVSGRITDFSADGVSGSVFLEVAGAPRAIVVNTVSGGVTARLDADIRIEYAITTASGRLQLDDRTEGHVRGRWTGVGGPDDGIRVPFRVNSVSGNISVVHAAMA
ncbi:MAG: DUF4097 family beta strand repeat-containing protein [Amnibacterium sp.]